MTANYPKQRPDLFWLVVGLIVLASFLSSCSVEQMNIIRCSKCISHTKDSSYHKVDSIAFDTTVKVPPKIIWIHDTVPCADFELKKDSGGVKLTVTVKDKVMTAKCETEALEIKIRLYNVKESIYRSTELTRYVTTRKKSNWWIWLLVGIGVGYLGPKILNLTGKLPFKL